MTTRHIAVFGNRVRDVTVDVDLPDLYRLDPELRKTIRFDDNDPIIRRGCTVRVTASGAELPPFDLVFEREDDEEAHAKVDDKDYYRLKGGGKYQLSPPPTEFETNAAGVATIEIPCQNVTWGGGGMNMVTACRCLSNQERTPISYIDTARRLSEQEWYRRLRRNIAKQFEQLGDGQRKAVNDDIRAVSQLLRAANDWKKTVDDEDPRAVVLGFMGLFETTEKTLTSWLLDGGERAYRALAYLLTAFDPHESADLFLAQHGIRGVMLREARGPAPINLVFSRIRDSSREIGDKMIFRGPRTELDPSAQPWVKDLVSKQVPDPGLIAINTVYDASVFHAALDWACDVQQARKRASTPTYGGAGVGRRTCPVLLVMTPKNREHFDDLNQLEAVCNRVDNLYVLFNETEFGDYIEKHDKPEADKFIENMKAGLRPHAGRLFRLFDKYKTAIPGADKKFIVTFGSLGSIGVADGLAMYVGTYTVPEKRIYGTNGCGDAFAAGVALLAHQKHNHDLPDLAPLGHIHEDGSETADLMLMMQLGTAAAYAKATSPTGTIMRRQVESLLETAYLPTAEPIGLSVGSDGPLKQPGNATLVGMTPILRHVLNA